MVFVLSFTSHSILYSYNAFKITYQSKLILAFSVAIAGIIVDDCLSTKLEHTSSNRQGNPVILANIVPATEPVCNIALQARINLAIYL